MPRKALAKKSVPLKITTSPEVVAYLNDLVDRGLHGQTAPAVAATLLGIQIQHLIETTYLMQRSPELGNKGGARNE